MKFSDIQKHLEKGGSIRRKCWNDYPHRAFYVHQIMTILIVDVNNKIMQSEPLECQIMANDWEQIEYKQGLNKCK